MIQAELTGIRTELADIRTRLDKVAADYSHAFNCNSPRTQAELNEISACAVALRDTGP
jgi:hypothetical protein